MVTGGKMIDLISNMRRSLGMGTTTIQHVMTQ